MKRIFSFFVGMVLFFSSCSTVQQSFRDFGAVDHRPLLELPDLEARKVSPGQHEPDMSYFATQAILYAELGARFYNLKDYQTARDFFELAVKYDRRNSKAIFSLGILDYQQGRYEAALNHFKNITPTDQTLFPYDIDYYEAARMVLSQFPLEGRIISLSRNDRTASSERVVVINRGRIHGISVGMPIDVYRIGNPIRDFETMEILGTQRTKIARVIAVDIDSRNTVCTIEYLNPDYFIQINDVILTAFGGTL
jgi:tetratricopeptide (TPR) repeat protein